jgi:3-oxoadipate enol-lactonase
MADHEDIARVLFVQQFGSGAPLMLIHGLMVTGEMFRPVIEPLSQYYRLIVPDLRGHGRSGHLPAPYTVAQLASDLAQVLDALGVESTHVLGYSHGAVAQQFALDYPARVRSLTLACTYAYNMLSRRERVEGALLPWIIRVLGVRRTAALIIAISGTVRVSRMPPETVRWLREMMASNDTAKMVAATRAMLAFDSRGHLGEIQTPTLVIAGSQDTAVPMHHARMLANGIKGAQLRVVEGAGHALIWAHPDDLARSVVDAVAA